MKSIISIGLLVSLLTACKKETNTPRPSTYLSNIQAALKDSLQSNDYAQLDFTKAVHNKVDNVQLYILRVPFKGQAIDSDFVIVKTTKSGIIQQGKIIHLDGTANECGGGKIKARRFDGTISISSLDRKQVLNSSIDRGFIRAFHPINTRETVYGSDEMPEVVVVAYVQSFQSIYSTWLYLTSLFYDSSGASSGGGGYGGYYGSMSGGGGGTTSSDAGADAGYADVATLMTVDQTILIDEDTYVNKSPIILDQYLKCFDNIPDAGAQCEITINTDIPVDTDPNKLFDFSTGSPGHTFIQLKKTNGSQTIMQNIGFYPLTGWKSITNLPTDAKFVDDSQHEFNASFSKSLTPDQLRSVITEMKNKETAQYDLDNFNCTDWSLDLFNKAGDPLIIPKYLVPGSINANGVNTPQGVYNRLNELKASNAPNSDKISIGFMKGWVADSHGPCN